MDEALGLLGSEIFSRQTTRLARAGIGFGEDGEQAGVGELRMCVTELEASPLGPVESGPAFGIRIYLKEIFPSDRLRRPTERGSHRAPHGDHNRGEDEGFSRRAERL